MQTLVSKLNFAGIISQYQDFSGQATTTPQYTSANVFVMAVSGEYTLKTHIKDTMHRVQYGKLSGNGRPERKRGPAEWIPFWKAKSLVGIAKKQPIWVVS
jgi:hypothetical protein